MDIYNDNRIVMTLDAGGTNFVFSAVQKGEEIVPPITRPSNSTDYDLCLKTLINGFQDIKEQLPQEPVAISFAFPGPADYENGIIGDLPNFPSFRGGVALGPMLEEVFGLPTIINNDGDLFTYGEAVAGFLPEVNKSLGERRSNRTYKNLIGVTLGTGFGGGIVVNGSLCNGDNSAAGEMWLMRNFKEPHLIAEEGVSIRGIQRYYRMHSGENKSYTPKEIYGFACGDKGGDQAAAVSAFNDMAIVVAEALTNVITLIDAPIVIGGGLSGASKFILPKIVEHLNGTLQNIQGESAPRLVSKVFNLEAPNSLAQFQNIGTKKVKVPFSEKEVEYISEKSIPIGISKLGTSRAVCLGAYAVALAFLNQMAEI